MSLFFTYFISRLFYGIRKNYFIADVTAVFVNMVFSDEDKIFDKKCICWRDIKRRS